MSTKHTPGPWDSENKNVWSENGLNADQSNLATTHGPFAKANAERIVACVNACDGIADPSAVKDLLEALRTLVQMTGNVGQIERFLDTTARAAIAKATGQPA
jgi:hypothetical protein